MPLDIIRPSRIQDKLDDLVISIDTSGSIQSREITVFVSVMRSIIETLAINNVHVIYWDTEVRSHEVYGETATPLSELVNTTKPKGGGGTSSTFGALSNGYALSRSVGRPTGTIRVPGTA